MYQNTFSLDLEYAGQPQQLEMRISVGSQLKLKREVGEEGIQLIFKAMDDLGLTVKVLTEALNFKGHQNVITDGAELYEVLIDNGYSGKEAFAKLLFDIASCSGMIKPEQAEQLSQTIGDMYGRMFSSLEKEAVEGETTETEDAEDTFREKRINA